MIQSGGCIHIFQPKDTTTSSYYMIYNKISTPFSANQTIQVENSPGNYHPP